jgi:DNA-directed RNA polymerase subunit RPC12/RpoP
MTPDNQYYVNQTKSEQKAKGETREKPVENPVHHPTKTLRTWTVTFNCGVCHTLGAYASYDQPQPHLFCPSCGSRITPKRVVPDPTWLPGCR